MQAALDYFHELTETIGRSWNRFWFTPVDPASVCVLRVLVGLAATYYVLSHTADLSIWFGEEGLLPAETARQLTGMSPGGPFADPPAVFRWSYYFATDTPLSLKAAHFAGLACVLAFTLGFLTRVTSVLSLVVVLALVHRAPMIAGQFDSVLSMLLLYLCFAPCGAVLSIDRFLKRRKATADEQDKSLAVPSMAANVSLRLMQVHVALLYLIMAFTKLGSSVWWAGEAMWWLIAHSESRLVDLTGLHNAIVLINIWTLAIVLFELAFATLIWNRLARPLLLTLAVVMWSSLAVITGLVSYCLLMMIANLCFVSPLTLRKVVGLAPG